MRERYEALQAEPARIDAALRAGERRADERVSGTLRLMMDAMGL